MARLASRLSTATRSFLLSRTNKTIVPIGVSCRTASTVIDDADFKLLYLDGEQEGRLMGRASAARAILGLFVA